MQVTNRMPGLFTSLQLILAVSLVNFGPQNAVATFSPKPNKIEPTQQSGTNHPNSTRPNILIILIDDMGINDVSFHGSNQILTPNIDALAYNGIILNKLYVPNLCTPSRATLLTGKYPFHTGTQHFVIVNDEPWGLPLNERTMPEIFRDAGYSTSLIGKWHLGFYRKEMTPTFRGFDHHYGYYSGYIDYYDHTLRMLDRNYSAGLDFRRDLKPWPQANGSYATDVFTSEAVRVIKEHDTSKPLFMIMSHLAVHTGNEDNPMQAPEEEVEKFMHISDPHRRTYAGMISSLDKSVGRTMQALANKGILDNTIVLLYSDNGAPTVGIHSNGGSNYPFKGQKESPWEGGIRSAGCIWSPLLKQRSYVSNQQIHSIDLFPTLAAAANVPIPTTISLDGVNMWDALNTKSETEPRILIHSLDDIFHYSSYMREDFKYVNGSTFNGLYDTWLGDLPENENDPHVPYYVQEVLSSQVQDILGDPSLNIAKIEKLREEATFRCPPNTKDYNAEIYQCEPFKAPCLFDITKDPCERYNLAKLYPLQVAIMEKELNQFRLSAVRSARVSFSDPKANPKYHRNTWEWWAKSKAPSLGNSCKNGLYTIFSCISVLFLLYLL